MKRNSRGAVLIFALVTILLMSLVGGSLFTAGTFHERLSANSRIDSLTFLAAESVIDATVSHIAKSERLRQQLATGKLVTTCMVDGGISEENCEAASFPLDDLKDNVAQQSIVMTTQATTTYAGTAPVLGYSTDILVNYRFVSEGRAYFSPNSGLPFGHLNLQTWQVMGVNSGAFYE